MVQSRVCLQRAYSMTTTATNITSTVSAPTSYVSINFTPVSASSTIVLRATSQGGIEAITGAGPADYAAVLTRGGTIVGGGGNTQQNFGVQNVSGQGSLDVVFTGSVSLLYEETSPGTSAVTYALAIWRQLGGGVTSATCTAYNGTLQIEEWI